LSEHPPNALRLAEILGALSEVLDMTEGQPPGHCMRAGYIGLSIGKCLGLGNDRLSDLYYTLLLKDLGCSSNAARICQLYLTDDLAFKGDFKRINGSLPQALRFVLSHTGLKAGLSERFRALIHIVQNGGEIARELIDTRCHRGAVIARKMRFSEAVADGIQGLDEHWDGSGAPDRSSGETIPLLSRIALVAQVADVFHRAAGPQAAALEVESRRGTWFDPAVTDAFKQAASAPDFWATLAAPDLDRALLALEPAQAVRLADEDYLDDIAQAFAGVIDSKSPYTRGHSERVTFFADLIAEEMQLTLEHRRWLGRAALLHDIGKLAVSSSILDKPGKLDESEWRAMKSHAAVSERVLEKIGPFRHFAAIAGAHHERLDGKGYPKGLSGGEISLETRILSVADVYDALTAARPYREAMPSQMAFAIIEDDIGTAFDPRCVLALRAGLRRINAALAA
jgi:HD-GYP domain-containing protein (c-di-GMP phosphodiesterase class II)